MSNDKATGDAGAEATGDAGYEAACGGTADGGRATGMATERITVADSLDLAITLWSPAPQGPEAGSGRAFLLVHGLASNARLWDATAERLAELGHPVAAVDLRGHGRSHKPESGYDIPTVSADVATVLRTLVARDGAGNYARDGTGAARVNGEETLGDGASAAAPEGAGEGSVGSSWSRPVVVGQSWGGNVVLELAATEPALLSGIACVDGGTIDLSGRFESWAQCAAVLAPPRLIGTPARQLEDYLRRAHPDWPESGILGSMANFEVRADGTVAPWLSFAHHLLVLRGLWDHRPAALYPSVQVPVLLLPADDGHPASTAAKRAEVQAALNGLPRAAIQWFAGDHDIHAQHPRELAQALHEATGEFFP